MPSVYEDTTTWCGEKLDEWPRVHSCLNDWCPAKSDRCDRCNSCVAILRKHRLEQVAAARTGK